MIIKAKQLKCGKRYWISRLDGEQAELISFVSWLDAMLLAIRSARGGIKHDVQAR